MKQPGFFDVEERLSRLSGLGDQLEAFSRTVNFEAFRPDLDKALAYDAGKKIVGRKLAYPEFRVSDVMRLKEQHDGSTQEAPHS